MNLHYIFFLKSYREGGLIDIFIMSAIILTSKYKGSFIVYLLIPILFSDRFFNLIWSNKNEKLFYLQFQKISLKKIASTKQIQFIVEFNTCYLLISLLLFFINQNFDGINQTSWLILNIFIFTNLIGGNIISNIFFNVPFVKSLIFLIVNTLATIIVFFISTYLIDFSLITFLLLLIFLIFYRLYTLNSSFNN